MLWASNQIPGHSRQCGDDHEVKANVTSLPLKCICSVNASNLILLSTGIETLPGVFWDQGNKGNFFRGTGEQLPKNKGNRATQTILENREHRKIRLCFWGTRPFFRGEQGNRYPRKGLNIVRSENKMLQNPQYIIWHHPRSKLMKVFSICTVQE